MTTLRRHWALAVVGALFVLVGAFAHDDYGIVVAQDQINIGNAALDYLAGDGERAFGQLLYAHDRYYGAIFEAPLVLVERILGLQDSWDVYRVRYLLTHLFFLGGGAFCYLLAYRLFGSRALALVAMALFLLHPRLYALSFFNPKDIPFLAAFMVALYLVHRAFRRETLGAFLLCGVGVGLLVHLRVMGIVLFAAVLVLRALDLLADGRKRTGGAQGGRWLATTGAFALAAILTYYASLPGLWTDPPGHFAELVRVLGSHPHPGYNLFRGEWLYSRDGPPFDYVPVWVGITTPPAVLLLALAGAAALVWRGARRPLEVLRNTPLRFGFLLIALPVATTVAVVVLGSNVYDNWRHLSFLYAPLLLLAVFGLHRLLRGRWTRTGAYALGVVAIGVTIVSLVRIHPHEDNYFNVLTDRTTPERLASRYEVVPQDHSLRVAAAGVLTAHPSGRLFVSRSFPGYLLPPEDHERLVRTRDFRSGAPNFFWLSPATGRCPSPGGPHGVRLYANTLRCVVDPVAYFGAARRDALATEPVVRARYDVYRDGRELTWVWDECPAEEVERFGAFFLHVYPRDAGDLSIQRDFDNRDWALRAGAARIDGNCVAVTLLPAYPAARAWNVAMALLPAYPAARVHTGQASVWSADVPPDYARARREALAGEPLARGEFTIHGEGRTLTYVRDGCTNEDAATPFFLHLYPRDAGDLPEARREHGFDNLDTVLTGNVGRVGGNCVAVVDLPDYPIASIRTGQHDGTGERWAVEFAPPE